VELLQGILNIFERPRIFKCYPLAMDFLIIEEDIVIALAVKRGIDVDKIDAFIGDVFPEDIQTVAKIECIHANIIHVLNLMCTAVNEMLYKVSSAGEQKAFSVQMRYIDIYFTKFWRRKQ
jgi:hypothetical protein